MKGLPGLLVFDSFRPRPQPPLEPLGEPHDFQPLLVCEAVAKAIGVSLEWYETVARTAIRLHA